MVEPGAGLDDGCRSLPSENQSDDTLGPTYGTWSKLPRARNVSDRSISAACSNATVIT